MSQLLLLARLLEYPAEEGLLSHLEEAREQVDRTSFPSGIRRGLSEFLDWMTGSDPLNVQESYVEMVDRSRRGSLHLFEHVHGESRERGAAMIDLREFYLERGFELTSGELPDWLPTVLEFASTAPETQGRQFLSELSPVVERIFAEHSRSGSLWAPVLEGVLHACGGSATEARKAPAPSADPHPDELWEEPAVEFAGTCSKPGVAP